MTNGDWIRGMTDEELTRDVIIPCHSYECDECPLRNWRGVCLFDADKNTVLEWLESEHRE